ncbi:MAG: phosphoribosylanthranilate isomerase [Pseudomonadota bacterium]
MTTSQPRRTRIKVCGFTRADHAVAAAELGVDALGLTFYPKSPRAVDLGQAEAVCRALPPFVTVVALFLDADAAEVDEVLRSLPVSLLQFHGTESPAYCSQFDRPYIRAVPRDQHATAAAFERDFPDARGFLYDSNVAGQAGGLGETFNWAGVQASDARPRILAGGLTPDNVAEGIHAFRPHAVDVSSGVERTRGQKDIDKIARFVAAVANADAAHHSESGS